MKSTMMGVLLVGVVVLGVAAVPGPARATVLHCGQSVGPGGTVVMSSDILSCTLSPALNVVGPVVVDMAGHTVSCLPPSSNTAIFVEGKGAILKNGVVRDCAVGVELNDGGGHQLLDIVATGNSSAGILVDSDHNSLSHNSALNSYLKVSTYGVRILGKSNILSDNVASNADFGFFIQAGATLNQLSGNIASANGTGFASAGGQGKFILNLASSNFEFGFDFEGSGGDQVVNNTAAGNGFSPFGAPGLSAGIFISAANEIVNGNRASGNARFGIEYASSSLPRGLVNGNIALGNGSFDLVDANTPNCGSATWVHNIFGSGSQGCIH